MSSTGTMTTAASLRADPGAAEYGAGKSLRHKLLRPWLVYNLELVPNDICTPIERVCIDLAVLIILLTLVYALSTTTQKLLSLALA